MLYNQKWTKLDISLSSLIAWLEQKPRDKTYKYDDCYSCFLAQYLKDRGFTEVYVNSCFYSYSGLDSGEPLPSGWNDIAENGGHTYGEALDRARAKL